MFQAIKDNKLFSKYKAEFGVPVKIYKCVDKNEKEMLVVTSVTDVLTVLADPEGDPESFKLDLDKIKSKLKINKNTNLKVTFYASRLTTWLSFEDFLNNKNKLLKKNGEPVILATMYVDQDFKLSSSK